VSERAKLAKLSAAVYARGMASSTGGNVSLRAGKNFVITPTGRSLARLGVDEIVEVDARGQVVSGGRPSKEIPFHLGIYAVRSDVNCVIHGHSAHAVAASTLLEPDPVNAFPVYTAGYVARVGRLPLIPYFNSGSVELAGALSELALGDTKAVLMANHGFVAMGPDPEATFNTVDELLDALQVFVLTQGRARPLHAAAEWPVGRPGPTRVLA
jgi:ribulose-5-phosphate 4-epimerase/fuculose-1-phosphate aldolase